MDDISVAGHYLGKIKQSLLEASMAKHYDEDDETSRGRKVRKHEESFVGILSRLQNTSKFNYFRTFKNYSL